MKYFLTGATGFIGGRLLRLLAHEGHEVVALVRDPAQLKELAGPRVRPVPGDVTDRESLRRAMPGVDGVFHLAAWYRIGSRHRESARRVNVEGTRYVLETARDLGVPRTVYTSTLGIFSDTHGKTVDETTRYDGPWLSEYEHTKWIAHVEVAEALAREGLPLVIVLPGLVYGPGDTSLVQDMLRRYLRRRLPLLPRGTAFCWAHVDDVARAHLLAMQRGKPGESYIVAGPPHTMIEALEIAERVTGIPAPRWRPGRRTLRALARLADAAGAMLPLPDAFRGETLRVTGGATYLGDNGKARKTLGYAPRSLEIGLAETLRFELERGGMPVGLR